MAKSAISNIKSAISNTLAGKPTANGIKALQEVHDKAVKEAVMRPPKGVGVKVVKK